jgi:thiosulfate dehydrogenase [quinone] large subunit
MKKADQEVSEMSVHTTTRSAQSPASDVSGAQVESEVLTTPTRRVLAALRIAFGFTFLWAFLDKTFALGFHTGYDQEGNLDRFGDAAWINGGSPTEGFLAFGADGPFKEFYNSIAGAAWADVLFMAGLLGIGLALLFGVGMRIAAITGALLYVLMWTVVLPPENNPVIDDHLISALTLVALAMTNAGDTWGLGRWWSRTEVVSSAPILR